MEERDNKSDNHLSSPMVFNIGTGKPTSVNELSNKMIVIFGLDAQPLHKNGKDRRGILYSYADVNKASEILHFTAKKTIDAGLREIIRPMLLRR